MSSDAFKRTLSTAGGESNRWHSIGFHRGAKKKRVRDFDDDRRAPGRDSVPVLLVEGARETFGVIEQQETGLSFYEIEPSKSYGPTKKTPS